ncbi:MAG: helix-hairpin-helix domain-containing protein [Deltaproteobacteria bacterium]|nr:helix-hairpin-helix domain-containing protein [Deltaproteobacteria bacterium]
MRKRALVAVVTSILLTAMGMTAMAAKRIPRKPYPVRGVVNINTAPTSKLLLLPYVGRSRARAIVQYRARHKFTRPADLIRVKGIGHRTFVLIKAHVTVSGPTTIRRLKPAGARRRR